MMFKKIILTMILLPAVIFLGSIGAAQVILELNGIWSGALDLGSAQLELIFHIELDQAGDYGGSLDVPAQGALGIPLSFVGEKNGQVVFDVPVILAKFSGKFFDGTLQGVWEQSGLELPLVLSPIEEEQIPGYARPQEPGLPYPYDVEEVVYHNEEAGIELAGTFTKPAGEGLFATVILISGSGPQDRNEEIMGHKPFLVLADYLTKRGIAVLRVDDRGVGASGGDFAVATTLDFASDVRAGVDYLALRTDVNKEQIGLIGHSEGGLIAPLVASERPEVSFIVLMAAPGLNGGEISLLQSALIQRASGVPEKQVQRELRLLHDVLTINKTEDDLAKAAELIREAMLARVAELNAEEQKLVGDPEDLVQTQLAQILSSWFRFFQTYDPLPTLAKVRCPVLAINGTKDLQVPATENLTKIEAALKKGQNRDYTIVELPNLNHLFQTCETGLPGEYALIEETISPLALDTVGDWILRIIEKN